VLFDDAEKPKPIANFEPIIMSPATRYTDGAEPEPAVGLKVRFANGDESKSFTVSMVELEGYNWLKIPGCLLHTPYAKAKQYLARYICEQLPNAPTKVLHRVVNLGSGTVVGKRVYNTGGELIMPSANANDFLEIELAPSPFTLDIDPDLSEEEAATGMIELISLFADVGRVVLAQMLLYIMSAVYDAVWKTPRTCVFLYGKSGTKKTTTAAFLTQLHNRSKGIESPARLNASIPAATKLLYEKRDCVVVLDDLFPTADNDRRKQQEKTLIEITRIIGDGIQPARMRGYEVAKAPTTCGVLFTAEYLIGTGSDAARLLPVVMTPPDSEKLRQFQKQPLMVSSFYRNYIQWYLNNFDDIWEMLFDWHEATFNKTNLSLHGRLRETHFF
jgi:hypothetical protein